MYHKSIVRGIKQLRVNSVVKVLILSDFLIWSASNLITPIFAIFVVQRISGAGALEVGIATTVFMLVKSTLQIPISLYIDRSKSENDDYYTMVVGSVAAGFVFFFYPTISTSGQLYSIQALAAVAAALAYPGWMSIFTRHVDKDKTAYEWSLEELLTGLGMASTAALGGYAAEIYGFDIIFHLIGIFTIIGGLVLLFVKNKIVKNK